MSFLKRLLITVAVLSGFLTLTAQANCGTPTSYVLYPHITIAGKPLYLLAWTQNSVNLNISLADYTKYIEAALTGQPLPVTGANSDSQISIPVCVGASTDPTQFQQLISSQKINTIFEIFASSWNSQTFKLNLANNADSSYSLQAQIDGYCPCSQYTGSTCNRFFVAQNYKNVLGANIPYLSFYQNYPSSEKWGYIGTCTMNNNPGALFLSVYAPPGQIIPPTGTYSAQVNVGIAPNY